MGRPIVDKTGETNINFQGQKMKIIRYKNSREIDVLFEDNHILHNVNYSNFKKGTIKNPYFPSVYGVGYFGEGKYKARENDKKMTKEYKVWFAMMLRCYGTNSEINSPTYVDCEVCDKWKNYQVFCDWFQQNYYELGDEKMQLDKDLLNRGNRIYEPDSCIFVPQKINALILKTQGKRGDLPIGVTYYKRNNKYGAQCCHLGKGKCRYLGLYDTPEEAFYVYKTEKERYVKQVADEYKQKYPQFPQRLYEAMMNYQVEITD